MASMEQAIVLLRKNAKLRRRTLGSTACELILPLIITGVFIGLFYSIVAGSGQTPDSQAANYDMTLLPTLRHVSKQEDTSDKTVLLSPARNADVRMLADRIDDNSSFHVKVFEDEADALTYYHNNLITCIMGITFNTTAEQDAAGRLFFPFQEERVARYALRTDWRFTPSTDSVTTGVNRDKKSLVQALYVDTGFVSFETYVDRFLTHLARNASRHETAVLAAEQGVDADELFAARLRGDDAGDTGAMVCGVHTNGTREELRDVTVGNTTILMSTRRFAPEGETTPLPPQRDVVRKMMRSVIGVFMLLAVLFSVYRLIADLVKEKETRIRETLMMMGCKLPLYYASWFLTTVLMTALPCLICVVMLKGSNIFEYSNVGILFVAYVLFVSSLTAAVIMITTFLNSGKVAAPLGAVLILAVGIAGAFLAKKDIPEATKIAWCLLSPIAFDFLMVAAANRETDHVGLTASTLSTKDGGYPDAGVCLAMLVVDTLLYLVLAWYLDKVVPSEYGTRLPLLFPFRKDYWFGSAKRTPMSAVGKGRNLRMPLMPVTSDSDVPGDDDAAQERDQNRAVAVSIRRLRKEYNNGVVALCGLDLDLYEGELLAFLGHNGAGKSTTISLLTGLTPPTSGDAGIFGHPISTEMHEVRKFLGVCPQHDVLWETLTVREHLEIFCALRGMSSSAEVNKWIDELDLRNKADAAAGTLSGGQKRKLCVGMAMCGDSKLVFLDECSSGVDPINRRALWGVINRNKAGRTIVLTTHFLDEADVLADRVAIMSKGKLRCVGTSMYLKAKFGTGYSLAIEKGERCDADRVFQVIRGHVPGAEVVSNVAAEMAVRLPRESVHHFSSMFSVLETESDALGIASYGMSLTTLEDVFLRIAEEDENNPESVRELGMSMKERRSTIDNHAAEVMVPEDPLKALNVEGTERTMWKQLRAMWWKRVVVARRNPMSLVAPAVAPIGLLLVGLFLLSLLGNTPIHMQRLPLDTLPVPANATGVVFDTPFAFPFGHTPALQYVAAQLPRDFAPVGLHGNATINEAIHDNAGERIVSWGGYDLYQAERGADCVLFNVTTYYNATALHALPVMVHGMNQAVLNASTPADTYYRVEVDNAPWPPGPMNYALYAMNAHVTFSLIALLAYGLATAAGATYVVRERETDVKLMQLTNGASRIMYWMSTWLFDLAVYALVAIASLVALSVYDFGHKHGSHAHNMRGLAALLFAFGPPGTLFTYCWSFRFRRYSLVLGALAGAYLLVGWFALPGIINAALLSGPDTIATQVQVFAFSVLNPSFGLVIGMLKLLDFAGLRTQVGVDPDDVMAPKIVGMHINIFMAQMIAFFLVLLVLEYRDDMRKAWRAMWYNRTSAGAMALGGYGELGGDVEGVQHGHEDEDADVRAERARVKAGGGDGRVVLRGLRKEFPSPFYPSGVKVAVRDMWLSVGEDTCLGLLGHNGAGKTSTLRMISCELEPTSGTALVNGLDVRANARRVRKTIGLCSQFDHLVPYLTGREHLTMYARLKGIPESQVEDVVNAFIDVMKLQPYADKEAMSYSGGNRRKISLSVALLGCPKTLAIDEASSGIDAYSRRFMWNLINKVRRGRSVILTTHSMEECAALCTRVSIMKNGGMVCLGSLQRLKSQYGNGYTLMVACHALSGVQAVHDFVAASFDDSVLLESHGTTSTYELRDKKLSLSHVFEKMEASKEVLHVEDYSVSQPTLEQVFVKLAKEDQTRDWAPEATVTVATMGDLLRAYLWLLLGFFFPGIHRVWLGKYCSAFFYLITCNGLLVGWLYDFFTMPSMVRETKRRYHKAHLACCRCVCCRK